MLAELSRGAEDLDPILHSFKNTQQLYVGVRNILAKEDIQSTLVALTNIAEVCLERIALAEYEKLTAKLGAPTIGEGPRAGEPCDWTILGMGKLGGRELNFHSDLDVVFLYEADGMTTHARRRRPKPRTTNISSASWGSASSRSPTGSVLTAAYTKSIRGCAPRADRARWRRALPSSSVTSPKERGIYGSGKR